MTSTRLALVIVVAAAVPACSESGGDADAHVCSPLAAVPPAFTNLGFTLGIGRHADGTVYALDQTQTGEYRVFSSSGMTLGRKPIGGFNRGTLGNDNWYVATVSDADPQFTLKIDDTTSPASMGVVRGAYADRDFVVGQTGDVLQVETADALAGMTIRDLPGDVTVEYFAHLADGRQLVVARPHYNWSYESFRLFLGTADRMAEREVTSVVRAKDGGTTTIQFMLDGAAATALFPSPLEAGAPSLAAEGATHTLTLEGAGASPASLSFYCL